MAGKDFSHLTSDELIKGIQALDLPDYIRSKAYGIDVRETLAQMTEMTIQLGVNMGLSPDDALKWARKLQESVSQSEFDSWVATLLDGGPSIFMNTLSELQTTYPNGAAGVALVRETDPAKIYVWNGSAWEDFGDYQGIEIKDGTVTTDKILDESVTRSKTDFYELQSSNLFNKDEVLFNTLVNEDLSTTTYNGYNSYKRQLKPNTKYYVSNIHNSNGIMFFDANDTHISSVNLTTVSDGNNYVFTPPSNVDYGWFRVNSSLMKKDYRLNEGGVKLPYSNANDGEIKHLNVNQSSIRGATPLTMIEDIIFDNLFGNEETTLKDTFINSNGEFSTNTNWDVLVIRVTGGDEFTHNMSFQTHGCYFDKDMVPVSEITNINKDTLHNAKWTVPNGVSYMGVNFGHSYSNQRLVNYHTNDLNQSDKIPYGYHFLNEGKSPGVLNDFNFLTIGDSITWLDGQTVNNVGTITGYQSQLVNSGAEVTNKGNSGATYRKYVSGVSDMQHGSIYDDIVTDQFDVTPYDVITLFGGTNDIGRGWNRGTDDSTDPNTTVGALRGIVDYIRANNPKAKIIILSPIQSSLASRPKAKMLEIADACKMISEEYSIKFVDMQRSGGIGKGNFDTLLYDELHPNNDGMEIIGKRFVSASKDVLGV